MDTEDWYYDNDEEPPAGDDDAETWLAVERIYGLDWHRFTPGDWDRLALIYPALPGRLPETPRTAQWFSTDQDTALHLWASVEPPGLQVVGILTAGLWRDWDTHFRHAVLAAGLPRYPCA
jgi:hypothetical protein